MDESKFQLLCRIKDQSGRQTPDRNQQPKTSTNAVHNNIYQLKVLMLFLYRGLSLKYNFRLGTEIKQAQKFDDLVFEYTKYDQKRFRVLQVKHKLDESKKITADHLLNDRKGDYSLIKYFHSYQKCKKEKLFENGTIDSTICTNINFDFENLQRNEIKLQQIEEKDDILYFTRKQVKKEPVCYKFDSSMIAKLEMELQSQSLYNEIEDFLDHLVFAVNQPNELELGNIVKKEIGKEFDYITTEHVYNKFLIKMLEWMQAKGNVIFLSYKDGYEFFEEAKKRISICFNVVEPVETFIGRNKQLKIINKMLNRDSTSQVVCICGLGGVGKSELARKYIADYSQYYDNKIVWINAESHNSLIDSFYSLASDKLKINTKNANGTEKDITSIVEDTYKFFSAGKCLFVFDNAEKFRGQSEHDNGIEKFFPSIPCNKPSILITSRNQKWPKNYKILDLDVLNPSEAQQYVKRSLGIENESRDKDVLALCEKLQGFPLALQEAVSYISAQSDSLKNTGKGSGISNYTKEYDAKIKELLDFDFLDEDPNIYCKTMFATWNVTLEAISKKESGKYALEMLYILSFLAADDIPANFFDKYIDDDDNLAAAAALLKQYSFINLDNGIISMHRLVQQFARLKVKEAKNETHVIRKTLQSFVDKSSELIVSNIKHAISLWIHATKHTELMEEFSVLPHIITSKLNYEKRHDEAYSFASEAVKLLNSLPSLNLKVKEDLALIKVDICRALEGIGKYDNALEILQHLYDSWIALQGPDNPMALVIKFEIVTVNYLKNKKKEESSIEYMKLIGISNLALGENNIVSLMIKDVYNRFITKSDDNEEVNQRFDGITNNTNNNEIITNQNSDVTEIKDKATCMTKSGMAAVHFRQGKTVEAFKLYQEAYADLKNKFGRDNHPEILSLKNTIAYALIQTGDIDDALKLVKEVDTDSEAEDLTNPVVLSIRSNLGGLYYELGKYNEALNILQDTYDKQKQIQGPDHSNTVKTQSFLGAAYYHLGNLKKALPIFQESLKRMINVKGNNHPDTLDIRKGIADIYFNRKDYNQAYKCFIELLALTEEIIGEGNEKTTVVRSCIIKTLLELGNIDKALEEYYKVLEIQIKIGGPEHLDTLTTMNNIGMMHAREKHEYDKALTILNQVVNVLTKKLGPDHSQTIKAKGNMEQVTKLQQENQGLQRTFSDLSMLPNNDLLIAVQKNKLTKVDILIKQGLDVNVKDKNNRTPLHRAINNDNEEIVKVLLKNGADLFQADKKGNTPLHVAALKGSCKIVESLLQNVERKRLIDLLDAKTTDGTRAIHMAVKSGSLETVKCLLKHGASFNVENSENKTPVDISNNEQITIFLKLVTEIFQNVEKGYEKVINKLNSLKSNESTVITNTRNHEGKTLMQVALINKQSTIANCILKLLKN